MSRSNEENLRVIAIAPSTRGFGFAVVEGENLVDWGIKSVRGDKNRQCLLKVQEMIAHYQPGAIFLQDHSVKGSRRSPRIRALGEQIIAIARKQQVTLTLFARQQVRRAFFSDGNGTKDALAEILAKRFPQELGCRLPAKRRPWMSEAYQMGIFDAVALGLMIGTQKSSQKEKSR
jgi:Holliday junction resolvasome RuvABC endonuclease subunit